MAQANMQMTTLDEVWLPHSCTKQWLITAYSKAYSPILRCCSLLLLTVVLDETCLLLLWDYDKKWSIPLSMLWMSDWLCDSDLRWWYSRCLLVGQDPGQWLLSFALRIPAETHTQNTLYKLHVILSRIFSISAVVSTLIWPLINDKNPVSQ